MTEHTTRRTSSRRRAWDGYALLFAALAGGGLSNALHRASDGDAWAALLDLSIAFMFAVGAFGSTRDQEADDA